MAANLTAKDAPPVIFYANPLRMAAYVLRHFGVQAMVGFARLMAFCKYPARVMDRFTPRALPPASLDALLAQAPGKRQREQLRLAFTGSAMDLVNRFLPDAKRHRTLRALLTFAAVQSTYKGPFTPGSALCLVYTFAQNEGGGLMRRVRGGMGSLSEALCRSIVDKGGEVRTKAAVRRVLIEGGRAVGVELHDGHRITARAVLSNLDKPATFFRLVGREYLDTALIERIERIEHRGAYVHVLLELRRLPKHGPPWEHLNATPPTRFNTTLVPDPERQQASYEACRRGELPEHPPVGMQIPTVVDPSLAPPGFHIATSAAAAPRIAWTTSARSWTPSGAPGPPCSVKSKVAASRSCLPRHPRNGCRRLSSWRRLRAGRESARRGPNARSRISECIGGRGTPCSSRRAMPAMRTLLSTRWPRSSWSRARSCVLFFSRRGGVASGEPTLDPVSRTSGRDRTGRRSPC